jgi:hypothetical protein
VVAFALNTSSQHMNVAFLGTIQFVLLMVLNFIVTFEVRCCMQ